VRAAFNEGVSGDIWGKPEATSNAILQLVDTPNPPLRLFPGKMALPWAKQVYTDKLSSWEEWNDVLKAGIIRYGQTKYDHANGSMAFIKPRQVAEFRNLEFEEDAFIIFIHEDFLHGHPLHAAIKKYGFFEYEVNEALHLSPKEEDLIWDLYNRIDAEYRNNPDEFSRNIMLTHIDSILTYAQRFYKRQYNMN
jgi:hypothetical protein